MGAELSRLSPPTITVQGLEIPTSVQTLDGFREWVATLPENGPLVSFARGRVHIEMGPQDYRTHEPLVKKITHVLLDLTEELDLGEYYFPPSWFTKKEADVSTEPDGFLVLWSSFEAKRVVLNPDRSIELLGTPDMVLEVPSKTSTRKDLVELVEDYARAGIREYWIADGRAEPPVLRILVLAAGRYQDQVPDPDGWLASPVWGRAFKLTSVVNRAGHKSFKLETRVLGST